jgi:hypothetical protein
MTWGLMPYMSTLLPSMNPQIVADLETMATSWEAVAKELVADLPAPVAAKPAPARKQRRKHKA